MLKRVLSYIFPNEKEINSLKRKGANYSSEISHSKISNQQALEALEILSLKRIKLEKSLDALSTQISLFSATTENRGSDLTRLISLMSRIEIKMQSSFSILQPHSRSFFEAYWSLPKLKPDFSDLSDKQRRIFQCGILINQIFGKMNKSTTLIDPKSSEFNIISTKITQEIIQQFDFSRMYSDLNGFLTNLVSILLEIDIIRSGIPDCKIEASHLGQRVDKARHNPVCEIESTKTLVGLSVLPGLVAQDQVVVKELVLIFKED